MDIQDWFPLGLTGLISLQSKGLSRVLSSTTTAYDYLIIICIAYIKNKINTMVSKLFYY